MHLAACARARAPTTTKLMRAAALATSLAALAAGASAQPAYDITGDGVVNIADAVKIISVSNGADTSPDCAADGASVCYEVGVASGLSNCDSTVMDHGSVNCRSAKEVLQIGSSTVFPVANAHSQRYGNPLVAPEARESGSSLGFKAFLAGGTDIATASRALKPSDYAKADCDESLVTAEGVATGECQGRFPVGIEVGTDLLAVFTQEGSTLASGTTLASLTAAINAAQTSTGTTTLCVPDAQSGTRDFAEEVLGVEFDDTLPNVNGFVDDAQIISCVATNPSADVIGIAPVSDVGAVTAQPGSGLAVVSIDGIDPTAEPVNTAYAMLRPLFKYFDQADNENNAHVRQFICSLLADQSQTAVANSGFVPLDNATRSEQLNSPSLACAQGAGVNLFNNAPLTGAFEEMSFCRALSHLTIIGSSTVYPFGRAIARTYPPTTVFAIARSTGSSVGISLLLAGATDIGAASRAMKGSDYEAFGCAPEGIQDGAAVALCQGVFPVATTVGFDLLSVIVPPDSPIAGQDVTIDQLVQLFTNGASFNSVFGLGPTEPPTLFVADTQSGTRGFWEDEVGTVMTGVNGFANDGEIIKGVAADPNAIGFVPVAALTPDVQALTINGVDPTSAADPSAYALQRPLYLITNRAAGAKNDIVDDVLCYALSSAGQATLQRVKYVAVPEDLRESQRQQLGCTADAN